jgi:hypothetical protein
MHLSDYPCDCLDPQYEKAPVWSELALHTEHQDTTCDGWKRLLDLVEQAAEDGREEFYPRREIPAEEWLDIITLPATIAKLKAVKHLMLYGSNLVRIPPEIGAMTALEKFTPYTSYRLHYFPYEITRCSKLKESSVSTRALYGNYKYRPPFPRLPAAPLELAPQRCSVCQGLFLDKAPKQIWLSLGVATDVLPLLVWACSEDCIQGLPKPSEGYCPSPHQGGLELVQPAALYGTS